MKRIVLTGWMVVSLALGWSVNAVGPLPLGSGTISNTVEDTLGIVPNVLPPPPTNQTVTLSWGDASSSNLVVNIQQSTNLTAPPDTWATLANVTNAGSLKIPATLAANFFRAWSVGPFLTASWNYTAPTSPSLAFRLYWRSDPTAAWTLMSEIPATNNSVRVLSANGPGQYSVTAANTDTLMESDFSNVVSWTNSVGQALALQIRSP